LNVSGHADGTAAVASDAQANLERFDFTFATADIALRGQGRSL
jgi:hypothetical protein